MSLAERLRALVAGLPPDGSALLSRRSVEEWLAEATEGDEGHDHTVAEVAVRVGRSENTVRRWLASGALRGYHVGGESGDWRVTPAALAEYRQGRAPAQPPVTLSAWRAAREGRRNGR